MVVEDKLLDALEYIPRYFKIMTKADETGVSHLVPMVFKPVQLDYAKRRTKRDIILKGRQMGISTGIMALNAHACFTTPYTKLSVITHRSDVSEFLLQTIHRFYLNLPERIKPIVDWASSSRIKFPDLDCLIHIDSAEAKTIGFGETLNRAHISELSRWPSYNINDLFAGITQTVPLGGYITIESTPRGRFGLFHDLYMAAKRKEVSWTPFFYPWWVEPEYRRPLPEGKSIIWTDEEKELIDKFQLMPEQIMFRRTKQEELRELFYQEYPENDIDCFLSSDISVFDGMALRRYSQNLLPGREEGHLTIWKDVVGGERYVIGVDVASGIPRGDFSVAAVISVRRNEYVARLRGRVAPDLFAEELYRLGLRYNNALVGVEKTGHGHMVLRTLLEDNYSNLYYHEDYDEVVKEFNYSQVGWKTSVRSKPIMVDSLRKAIRAYDLFLWSENFLREAESYIWDGVIGGKTRKSSGSFDDELDAVMIALQLRESIPVTESERHKVLHYGGVIRL